MMNVRWFALALVMVGCSSGMAPGVDAFDDGGADTAVAVPDAADGHVVADEGVDAGVRDAGAPTDTGPADAGPTGPFDLNQPHDNATMAVLFEYECTTGATGCHPIGYFHALGLPSNYNATDGETTACSVVTSSPSMCVNVSGGFQVVSDVATNGRVSFPGLNPTVATVTAIESGPTYPANGAMRINVHLEFQAAPTSTAVGATGVTPASAASWPAAATQPGYTVSPTSGDVWLMGWPL